MTDRTRVLIARSMSAIAVVGAVVGVVWLLWLGETEALWEDWVIHNGLIAVGSGIIAWTVAPGQPRNAEIWVFAWAGLFTGLLCLLYGVGTQALAGLGMDVAVLEVVPADVPVPVAVLFMFINFLWVGVFFPFSLGIVLFPDGKPPSPRWRWLVVAVIVTLGVLCAGLFWAASPSTTVPLAQTQDTNAGLGTVEGAAVTISYLAVFALVPLCVTALIVRFRRSSGVVRQQFRWVVWGGAVTGFLMVTAVVLDEALGRLDIALFAGLVAMAALLTSFGIAITKYRLYDVDTVISRTFVYGVLAAFIAGTYVAVVAGLGAAIGGGDDPSPVLAVGATAVIAILFQPLRRRLERVASRLVYGKRATPYEVLSAFSQRVAATDEGLLEVAAGSLVGGTGAESAAIWILERGSWTRTAVFPGDTPPTAPPDLTVDGDDLLAIPVEHDGELLGAVTLRAPAGQRLDGADRRLTAEVAGAMGLALRNQRLTDVLRRRVEALRDSRRRIVAVQDETRRTLERDLHDGAQQQLVALKVKIGLARQLAAKDGAEGTAAKLAELSGEADEAVESMRDFARGIYPPLLEAEGLEAALSAQARRSSLPVTVTADGAGRYPREVEATVYFFVLEAIRNMARAGATDIEVALGRDDGSLRFEVAGPGAARDLDESQFVVLHDRIAAASGEVTIGTPNGRLAIAGRLPLEAPA